MSLKYSYIALLGDSLYALHLLENLNNDDYVSVISSF